MRYENEKTLWTGCDGIRCVLITYDEARYQLRLVREHGTVKADLFSGYSDALAAARKWREQMDAEQNFRREFLSRR